MSEDLKSSQTRSHQIPSPFHPSSILPPPLPPPSSPLFLPTVKTANYNPSGEVGLIKKTRERRGAKRSEEERSRHYVVHERCGGRGDFPFFFFIISIFLFFQFFVPLLHLLLSLYFLFFYFFMAFFLIFFLFFIFFNFSTSSLFSTFFLFFIPLLHLLLTIFYYFLFLFFFYFISFHFNSLHRGVISPWRLIRIIVLAFRAKITLIHASWSFMVISGG